MLTEFFEASALDASWWSKKKNGGSLGVSYWDDMMNNVRIEPPAADIQSSIETESSKKLK